MTFVGLSLLALGAFALLGLRLWRQVKALGRDLTNANALASRLGEAAER